MAKYDPNTALLIVDVQNDFADPGGSLYVKGGEDVVPVVNVEMERALEAGALVVLTQDWHPESTPHFSKYGGIWPVHCVADTWGSELHPDLREVESERIRKGAGGEDGYSAFSVRDPRDGARSPTRLEGILRAHGIERVVIAGLATDYCVVETALDARSLGFDVVVLSQAIRAVDLQSGDGERALQRMRDAGAALE
jgi:nicotinamidase/pyrazinamidase